MFNYGLSAQNATRLITNFGRAIQYVPIIEGEYDPTTGAMTTSETSTNVMACDFDFEDKSGGQGYQNGLIQAGDRYALVAPTIPQINTSDKLIIDGVKWSIISVKRLAPAGITVLWNCHIRK